MDINTLVNLGLQLLGSGGGVWILTQIVKVAPMITSISPGQTSRIRTLAGVLSAVSVVILALVDKNLAVGQLQALVMALVAFAGTWGIAHGIHELLSKIGYKPEVKS